MLQIPGGGEKRAYTKFFDETCNFFLLLFAMLMLQVCDEKHPGPAPDLIRIAEMDEAVRLTRSYHFFVRWDFLAILELVGYSGRGRKLVCALVPGCVRQEELPVSPKGNQCQVAQVPWGSVHSCCKRLQKSYRFAIQYRQAMMFPTKLYRQFPTWKSYFHAENAVRKHHIP